MAGRTELGPVRQIPAVLMQEAVEVEVGLRWRWRMRMLALETDEFWPGGSMHLGVSGRRSVAPGGLSRQGVFAATADAAALRSPGGRTCDVANVGSMRCGAG